MISKLIGNEGSNIVLKIYFPRQLIYSQKYIPLIKDSTLKQKTVKQLVPSSKLCRYSESPIRIIPIGKIL